MQEEFHAVKWPEGPFKQLYGWGTISANIWLPSLKELVGIDPNQYYEPHGCYYSAMQGLNTSTYCHTDAQGGEQWEYFTQYNTSGGGEAIMNACNQQKSWLRSPVYAYIDRANSFNSTGGIGHTPVTDPYAVHPARRCKFHISRFRLKRQGESSLTPLYLLSTKRHVRTG